MSCEEQMLQFYKSTLQHKLLKVLSHVDTTFGINMVLYTWISKDGFFFQISNQPSASEIYYSNKLYLHNPTFIHPHYYIDRLPFFWDEVASKEALDDQEVINRQFGFRKFFFIPRIIEGDLHLFCFSSSYPKLCLNTLVCQNQSLLFCFADYVIDQWRPYFRYMDPFTISLKKIMGGENSKAKRIINHGLSQERIKEFGYRLGILSSSVLIDKLTRREKDCITLLLRGKRTREIAKNLHIDTRTVYYYLDNAKSKLGCATKFELIEMLKKFHEFGLFA